MSENKQVRRRKLEARCRLLDAKPEPVMLGTGTGNALVAEGLAVRTTARVWDVRSDFRTGRSLYRAAVGQEYKHGR